MGLCTRAIAVGTVLVAMQASSATLCGGVWCAEDTGGPWSSQRVELDIVGINFGDWQYSTSPGRWDVVLWREGAVFGGSHFFVIGSVPRSQSRFVAFPGDHRFEFWAANLPPPPPASPPPAKPPEGPISYETVQRIIEATDGAKDAIKEWVAGGGDKLEFFSGLGQRITNNWSSMITRLGGLINSIGLGALDPDVAVGVSALHQAINDPDDRTRGLGMAPQSRRQLQDILTEIERQGAPIQPQDKSGGTSTFSIPVQLGTPYVLDPVLAQGFEYRSFGGSPAFMSVALPLIAGDEDGYVIEIDTGSGWRNLGPIQPLIEFFFDSPVGGFRVTDIDPSANIGVEENGRWLTQIAFAGTGAFSGSMAAIPGEAVPEPRAVSEPNSLILFALGATLLAGRTWSFRATPD